MPDIDLFFVDSNQIDSITCLLEQPLLESTGRHCLCVLVLQKTSTQGMETQDCPDSALEEYSIASALMGLGDQDSMVRTPTIDGLTAEYEGEHGAEFTPLRDASDWRLVDFLADDACLCPSRYLVRLMSVTGL